MKWYFLPGSLTRNSFRTECARVAKLRFGRASFSLFLASSLFAGTTSRAEGQQPWIRPCSENQEGYVIVIEDDAPGPDVRASLSVERDNLVRFAKLVGNDVVTINLSTLPYNPAFRDKKLGLVDTTRGASLLEALREAKGKLHDRDIRFVYAGHGEACDGSDSVGGGWCTDERQGHLTDTDLLMQINPSLVMVDACYSGHFDDSTGSIQTQSSSIRPISLIASALPGELASASAKEGGVLGRVIQGMMNATPDQACLFDFDGDGEISEREFAAATLIGFYGNTLALRTAKEDPAGADYFGRPQLPVSKVSDRCLFKMSPASHAYCEAIRTNVPVAANRCELKAWKLNKIASTLDYETEQDKLSFLYDKKGIGHYGSSGTKHIFLLQRSARQNALEFLNQWRSDLNRDAHACLAGSDGSCQATEASLDRVSQSFDSLSNLIMNLR